jgi:hypothetical protein
MRWTLGAWCAGVLIVPFVVFGIARATHALPSRAEWDARGEKHGPWHSSLVSCSHGGELRMLAVSQGRAEARAESEEDRAAHRACRRKAALLAFAGRLHDVAWFSLPIVGLGFVAALPNRPRLFRPRVPVSAGIALALSAAAWVLQLATVSWVFQY